MAKAIEKFRQNFQSNTQPSDIQAITKVIEQLQQKTYKKRFLIKAGDKLKSIQAADIAAFYSMAKGTFMITNTQRNYSIDIPLDQLIN